jgi:hypothetical protein
MISDVQRQYLARVIRPMQIIVAALAAGVLAFMVVALLVRGSREPAQANLVYIALAFSLIALVAWAILPNLMTNQARRQIAERSNPPRGTTAPSADVGEVGHLAAVYQTRLIIGAAILEGAAFFNLVAYLVEGHALGLAAAVVLLVMMILFHFPTFSRLEDWVRREMETIQLMRGTKGAPRK